MTRKRGREMYNYILSTGVQNQGMNAKYYSFNAQTHKKDLF
jgi:hypothetical protein